MKTKIIFFLLCLYVFGAFIWWGYSLVALRRLEVENEKRSLYKDALSLSLKWSDWAKSQPENSDKNYMIRTFQKFDTTGNFEVQWTDNPSGISLSVRPREEKLASLDRFLYKKTVQYVLEGTVFIILVFWGMMELYRAFRQRMLLNQQQNNFILSVTHELKTPVAGIKLLLQTLKRRNIPDEQKQEMIAAAVADTERLEELVENVLITSRIDNFKYDFHLEQLDVVELLESMVSKYERINKKQQQFVLNADGVQEIQADRFSLTTAFDNLLSNAVKYSPEGSSILIDVHDTPFSTMVIFRDQAAVIPKEERKNVFRKFYRIGNENTRNNKGTGLGLYIVGQVLQAHDATIEITEREDLQGNAFLVEFSKKEGD